MDSAPQPSGPVPDLRHPKHDWQKIVLFVLTLVGAAYAFSDKILALGRTTVSIEKIDRIEAKQNEQDTKISATAYEVRSANAAAQRAETGIGEVNRKVDHINDVLMQIRLTGRR